MPVLQKQPRRPTTMTLALVSLHCSEPQTYFLRPPSHGVIASNTRIPLAFPFFPLERSVQTRTLSFLKSLPAAGHRPDLVSSPAAGQCFKSDFGLCKRDGEVGKHQSAGSVGESSAPAPHSPSLGPGPHPGRSVVGAPWHQGDRPETEDLTIKTCVTGPVKQYKA